MFGHLSVSMYFLFEAPLVSVCVAGPAYQADPDNFCMDRSVKYVVFSTTRLLSCRHFSIPI